VDHFYLYDTTASERSRVRLAPYMQRGLVTHTLWRAQSQHAAYSHALRTHGLNMHWLCFIDVDEFLVPEHPLPPQLRVSDVMRMFAPDVVGGMEIPRYQFGSSGHVRAARDVLDSFTTRAALPDNHKSCANPLFTRTRVFSVHHPEYTRLALILNHNSQWLSRPNRTVRTPAHNEAMLRLNHYAVKVCVCVCVYVCVCVCVCVHSHHFSLEIPLSSPTTKPYSDASHGATLSTHFIQIQVHCEDLREMRLVPKVLLAHSP